jgi:nitrite reductase/ring-hydroxylating ferredoxin subunit
MPLVKVASLDQIEPGTMIEARVGEATYVISNVAGSLHALDGVCPHRGGPLAQGALHGHSIVCPWHAWEFDCRSGEHDYNPSIRLTRVPVKVEGQEVFLELP